LRSTHPRNRRSTVRYGYFRIYIVLRRERLKINHKRVYRLYREEGLSMRMRGPRRHVSAARRMERPQASAANECWSIGNAVQLRVLVIPLEPLTARSPFGHDR
jgi:hypothetical protein